MRKINKKHCLYEIIIVLMIICIATVYSYAKKPGFEKRKYSIPQYSTLEVKLNIKEKARYWSSNKKIATIKKGKLTGKRDGKCRIYAKVGRKKYSALVIVKKKNYYFEKKEYIIPHKTSLMTNLNISKKAKYRITAQYWSTDKSVATIQKGMVVAKKRGKCKIYAKVGKQKCSAEVFVKANPGLNAEDVPILTFHRIVADKEKKDDYADNQWTASRSDFEAQIKWLKENGYITVDLDRFYKWYHGKATIPENAVVLTFDDGYYETYFCAYPIIKKYGFKATNFIVGAFTPQITADYSDSQNGNRIGWDRISETKAVYPDFDYQSHSYNMHRLVDGVYRVNVMTREEIKEDIQLMESFGFKYFAYPYGETNETIKQELKNSNIKMAFGFRHKGYAKKSDNEYEINRIKINGKMTMDSFKKIINRY